MCSDKIARESLKIEGEPNPHQEGQEWRRLVGSIRRKVQRHASASTSTDTASGQSKSESVSRKNSLTKGDMSKKEKIEEKDKGKTDKQPLAKQKSIGPECSSRTDYFRALSFRDKHKSVSMKHADSLVAPKTADKGVRKSDKKDIRHSLSFSKCKSSSSSPKAKEGLKHDDFLKATMRIFLVVSPPVGKLQVGLTYYCRI
ncbi:hypothetical protein GWI33_005743 [Rhynchophorus ferrugineus]|uniref:Uncharacterized protein n=1 Tax=Rhynchophorus ferrugineus TaxID=354439 RepID=A0A834IMP9_RHYFE|nr:hypothetical protein GWI33_005743 [Rhynchophorus ferrugineus]